MEAVKVKMEPADAMAEALPSAAADATASAAPSDIEALLVGLNPEQRAAVTHDGGPLLIVAGAGTGKTTVVSKRIAWLIATGRAKPEEILALTFTEKAAGEMTERVDELLPLGYTDLWISTFHAFCHRVLEERGLDIGLPNEFRLLDGTDSYLLVRRNLEKLALDYYKPLGNPTKFLHAMLKHFSRAKDEDIAPEDYVKFAQGITVSEDLASEAAAEADSEKSRLEELAGAYHTYQRLLLDEGALDLGDLQMYAIRLFRTRPKVLAEFRKRFKYVLVDEFQDTNWAQFELIKMLLGGDGNLAVVGDDDQSIYKFRGASVSNILQFKEIYPAASEVVLTKNYRSKQEILDAAYAFIQKNNPNRLEARMTTADGRPLVKRLEGQREGKGIIEHLRYGTHDEEVAGVTAKIIELKDEDPDRSWSDFAILVRGNAAADDYSRMCQRRGIPYQFLALRGLYSKPVIMDCLAYFTLLDDYHESVSLYRVLSSPPYAVTGEDLVQLAHEARKKAESMYSTLGRAASFEWLTEESRGAIARLQRDLAVHTALARKKGAAQVLIAFLTDSGYLRLLKSADDARTREQYGYLHQLLDRLKKFEESHDEPSVRKFLEEYAMERESGEEGALAFDPDTGPDMVRIMTVHASKGLEFPFVFIVDMVDKRFPTVARGGDIELPDALTKEILPEGGNAHLEEERRLMYVAMTRAKDGLFLTSAEDYGGKTKKKPSVFLAEIGLADVAPVVAGYDRMAEPETPAAPAGAITLPIPAYFSFSQIAAYDNCPLQYKFAHVIRVPSLGKGTQSFGNTIHAALEWFVMALAERAAAPQGELALEKGRMGNGESGDADEPQQQSLLDGASKRGKTALPVTLDELLQKYEDSWIDDWYESAEEKAEYHQKGRDMLEKFYDRCEVTPPNPLHVEQEFSLKFGTHTLKGAIDRIDNAEGGVEIIDYKTGRPKTEDDLELDDKKQLLLYQIVTQRLLGKEPKKLTFEYLQDGTSVSFLGTEKQLAKLETQVEETFANITARKFEPTPGRQCKYCDFREICEFRAA
ncbi:MAG: hypothetical protein RLZZ324_939 [Candidatus Parcubacteria bacterium]|jgi:DNA helicase-2/ATP-dependent DNA helicase PcrA